MIGTTIETSIRIMSRWGKDGVVRTEKDGFVVVDRAALEAVALSQGRLTDPAWSSAARPRPAAPSPTA